MPHPPIRTFKPRRGRVTPGQQRALDECWEAFGLEVSPEPLDPADAFGRTAPLVLEIGFGMGEATAQLAADDPGRDVLAVDVHTPGAGALLAEVRRRGLTNVRVALGDAVEVLAHMLAPGSLDEVRAFFPDPWPKSRHAKRRLVSPPFAALVADRLRVGGVLHVATDWPPYADQVVAVVTAEPRLRLRAPTSRPAWRPVTRFERQGLAKGHPIADLLAERV